MEKLNDIKRKKMLETNSFLQSVKNMERRNQLFIDGYSVRENKTNKTIKEFNKLLGTQSYFNKKAMNYHLQMFINAKENIEMLNKAKLEEEQQRLIEEENTERTRKQEAYDNYKLKMDKEKHPTKDDEIESDCYANLITFNDKQMKKGAISKEVKDNNYKLFLKRKEDYIKYMKEKEEDSKKEKIIKFKSKENIKSYLEKKQDKKKTGNSNVTKKKNLLNMDQNSLFNFIREQCQLEPKLSGDNMNFSCRTNFQQLYTNQ